MSSFLVDPSAVTAASLRLHAVTAGVVEVHDQLGGHVGAATGTPAAGALDDLLGHLSASLGQFSAASAALAAAVAGAATAYQGADGTVAAGCAITPGEHAA